MWKWIAGILLFTAWQKRSGLAEYVNQSQHDNRDNSQHYAAGYGPDGRLSDGGRSARARERSRKNREARIARRAARRAARLTPQVSATQQAYTQIAQQRVEAGTTAGADIMFSQQWYNAILEAINMLAIQSVKCAIFNTGDGLMYRRGAPLNKSARCRPFYDAFAAVLDHENRMFKRNWPGGGVSVEEQNRIAKAIAAGDPQAIAEYRDKSPIGGKTALEAFLFTVKPALDNALAAAQDQSWWDYTATFKEPSWMNDSDHARGGAVVQIGGQVWRPVTQLRGMEDITADAIGRV